MSRYVDGRNARPGLWLMAALAASTATYASAAERSAAVMPWLLLDLWLAHRIWRGGATALSRHVSAASASRRRTRRSRAVAVSGS